MTGPNTGRKLSKAWRENIAKSLTRRFKRSCKVTGCPRTLMRKSGYCNTHHYRFEKGLPLDSPIMKGVKGEKHWNWRGGASEYKNMYEMKKIRKIVLEEENYTCHYCGCYTDEVHHKDLSKDNHVRENLTACCRSCNLKRAKKHRSHKEAYNITISTHKKRLAF